MKRYPILLVPFLLLATLQSNAQQEAPTDREAAQKPLWIPMLDDTTANYFTVERVFNIYFQHHEMPEGENEEIGEHAEREKFFSRRARRRIDAENALRMDVKRYLLWRRQTEPYVQEDGRILTPTEQLAIWKQQQE